MCKVKSELADWINGSQVVARRVVDKFDTEIVVTQSPEGLYSVLRGFSLGEGAAVSVDVNEERVETVLEHLLSNYKD